jgi:hypothetical protein
MSARKLSRLAGLVFVLAAIIGGTASAFAGHENGGVVASSAAQQGQIDINWG